VTEMLCPLGDGRHKKLPWAGDGRSGFACVRCSKTWEWVNVSPDHVRCVPTYDLPRDSDGVRSTETACPAPAPNSAAKRGSEGHRHDG
jgi:hypothetical protein